MKFEITNSSKAVLKNKAKLYSAVNKSFNKAFFKVNGNTLTFVLRGTNGVMRTTLDIENNDSTDVAYLSVDYTKWNTALQKFDAENSILCSVKGSSLTLGTEKNTDAISLSINTYDSDSQEANVIDNFIDKQSAEITKTGHEIVMNNDIVANLLMVNAFMSQGSANSIGLGKDEAVYASRAAIIKAHLDEPLPSELFEDIEDGDYIFIHTDILNLMSIFHQTNDSVWFSEDYEIVYWHDDDTDIVVSSESRNVSLPSQEEFEELLPVDENSVINVSIENLDSALAFFNGFYEDTVWKPIKFDISKKKGANLRYASVTTNISKEINGATGKDGGAFVDGTFVLASDALEKLLSKVSERLKDTSENVILKYDEDSMGVYVKITDKYEFLLSKLSDDEE